MFKEFKLNNGIKLRNNIVLAPMTTWASNDDLTVSDDEAKYYRVRSTGVGMVITGCTFFSKEGQGFENEFYGGSDDFIPSLKKLADAIKVEGAKAVLQIFHAGRMGLHSNELVSASSIRPTHTALGPVGDDSPAPRELTKDEIWALVDGFYETTRRAILAGFDGVEIHGANTYLIQQFFSPHSNRRNDEFGGSLEKRMRFPLEVIKAVNRAKNQFADDTFIVGYRFSPEEQEEPGITIDDTLSLVDKLADEKLDYLHASLWDYKLSSMRDENDKRLIGKLLKEKLAGRMPFMGAGRVYTGEDLTEAQSKVGFDLVAIGHGLITDKDWVQKIEQGEVPNNKIYKDKLEEQVIPQKMGERLIAAEGWFEVE